MSPLRESVATAFRALRANWLRSSLTMLGIVIGVASVVLLLALGQGVKAEITKEIEGLGAHVAFVVPGKLDRSGQPNPGSLMGVSTLTERDASDLGSLPGVEQSIPLMLVYGSVERRGTGTATIVLATTAGIAALRPRPFAEGRFFEPGEEDQPVCVLGGRPKAELFGDAPALGETVKVRDVPFRVVGVLAPEEPSLLAANELSNAVFLPLAAARRLIPGGQINRIIVRLDYRNEPTSTLAAIRERLRVNHRDQEDFGVLTQEQVLAAVARVLNLVTALLAGISAISLVVAGVGVMNIMLVTVTERTHEIGVRKSVGARRRDVFRQFLTEALTLCLIGGAVGTLIAAGVCAVIASSTPLRPLMTVSAVLLAFGVCTLVGLVFGLAPALRAARQDPVQALRWE